MNADTTSSLVYTPARIFDAIMRADSTRAMECNLKLFATLGSGQRVTSLYGCASAASCHQSPQGIAALVLVPHDDNEEQEGHDKHYFVPDRFNNLLERRACL